MNNYLIAIISGVGVILASTIAVLVGAFLTRKQVKVDIQSRITQDAVALANAKDSVIEDLKQRLSLVENQMQQQTVELNQLREQRVIDSKEKLQMREQLNVMAVQLSAMQEQWLSERKARMDLEIQVNESRQHHGTSTPKPTTKKEDFRDESLRGS